MHDLEQREKGLNMYFREGRRMGEIADILGIPRSTVKSWVHRYIHQNGITVPSKQYQQQLSRQKSAVIKSKHRYTPRVKTAEQSTEERIAQLEMEVDLLQNFLMATERR